MYQKKSEDYTLRKSWEIKIRARLRKLKTDNIHESDSFNVQESKVNVLKHIFQKYIASGIIPPDWKVINVILLFKGKSKYRQLQLIPLGSVVRKFLEMITKVTITSIWKNHNTIKQNTMV